MPSRPTYKKDINQDDFPGEGSRLVYGTSGLGGVWGEIDPVESVDCLLYAFEQGICSVDTSPSYSESETIVGRALAQWKGERPFISTKVGRLKAATAFDAKLDYSKEGMKESFQRSLDTLQVDAVDLLFLHEPQWVPLERIDEIFETLQEFKEQGKVGMIGCGGNPPPAFMPLFDRNIFEVVSTFCRMDACNLSAFEEEVTLYQKKNVFIYAASSLHFGLLGTRLEQYTENPPKDNEYISAADIYKANEVNKLARSYDLSLSSLAQRYLFSMQEATRVVMGARNMNQIKSSLEDWKQGALPKLLFDEITELIL